MATTRILDTPVDGLPGRVAVAGCGLAAWWMSKRPQDGGPAGAALGGCGPSQLACIQGWARTDWGSDAAGRTGWLVRFRLDSTSS